MCESSRWSVWVQCIIHVVYQRMIAFFCQIFRPQTTQTYIQRISIRDKYVWCGLWSVDTFSIVHRLKHTEQPKNKVMQYSTKENNKNNSETEIKSVTHEWFAPLIPLSAECSLAGHTTNRKKKLLLSTYFGRLFDFSIFGLIASFCHRNKQLTDTGGVLHGRKCIRRTLFYKLYVEKTRETENLSTSAHAHILRVKNNCGDKMFSMPQINNTLTSGTERRFYD